MQPPEENKELENQITREWRRDMREAFEAGYDVGCTQDLTTVADLERVFNEWVEAG